MKIVGTIQETANGDTFVAVSVGNKFEIFKNNESINQASTIQKAIAIMNKEIRKAKRAEKKNELSVRTMKVGQIIYIDNLVQEQAKVMLRNSRSLCNYYNNTQGKEFRVVDLPDGLGGLRKIKIVRTK